MSTKDTFFLIPHTHWEGAVFKTREQYLDIGLPHILKALRLLKTQPTYRFTLDQACYVKPFLERYPEEADTFRRFVNEGRLAIVGGTDVMSDVNMPGGESFVRQVLYGKGFLRQALGVDVTVGWQLDTFGHHAQMPQLLKLADYRSFWFFRGVASWNVPAEFIWEGIDGSRVPAFWLPEGYCNLYGSPKTLPEFAGFINERYGQLARFARGPVRVGFFGWDVGEPEEHVASLVEQYNHLPDAQANLRIAVPADYEAAVEQHIDRPVIAGELNPIFQGTYSSRIELKQRTRELEALLTDAEKLGAVLRWLGLDVDDSILWRAWEPMLFNHAHDLMSGVMTDHVYEDTIRGYDFARRLAEDELQARRETLAARVDTRGDGIPVVVFNTLGWQRTDLAIVRAGFSDPDVRDVKLVGPDGQPVPCQIIDARRHDDGSLLQADVAFVARDVPALGHAVYRLLPQNVAAANPLPPDTANTVVLENEHYRMTLDAATGAITSLVVKDGDWEALSGPANVVAMEKDAGDFWELYRPLDGGSRIAMTDRHDPPKPGDAVFSTQQATAPGVVSRGPVFSELTVSHPFSSKGRFQTTVRVYAGLQRIDIRTRILNCDEHVRYRALFPTAIREGENVHEIPFGAVRRPDGIEFPAQNWIDWGDGGKGIALLNRGLPGNCVASGTMMLSLLRSTRIVAYGFMGGYEPGMGSDTGLEMGKELSFDYALLPHDGDWRQAAVYRHGQEFNHPFIAITAAAHAGALPKRWGFLEVTPPNVVVSALRNHATAGIVLRVYEAAGQPVAGATIKFPARIVAADELNLMEDVLRSLDVERAAAALRIDLKPFEIKTIGVRFQ